MLNKYNKTVIYSEFLTSFEGLINTASKTYSETQSEEALLRLLKEFSNEIKSEFDYAKDKEDLAKAFRQVDITNCKKGTIDMVIRNLLNASLIFNIAL